MAPWSRGASPVARGSRPAGGFAMRMPGYPSSAAIGAMLLPRAVLELIPVTPPRRIKDKQKQLSTERTSSEPACRLGLIGPAVHASPPLGPLYRSEIIDN